MATVHPAISYTEEQSAPQGEGFADSFALYALIVMGTFAVAIAFAVVGLSQPSWLGFS